MSTDGPRIDIPDGATTQEVIEAIPPEITAESHPELWENEIVPALDNAISLIGRQQLRDKARRNLGLPTHADDNSDENDPKNGGRGTWHVKGNKSVNAEYDRLAQNEVEQLLQCVATVWATHPEKSRLPIAATHGEKIRADFADQQHIEFFVPPDDPDDPHDTGHTATEPHRADAVTWIQAVRRLLVRYFHAENTTIRLRYGRQWSVGETVTTSTKTRTERVAGREIQLPDNDTSRADVARDGRTFDVPATLRWQPEYQQRYAAQIDAWTREYCGGRRPSGGECDGVFSDPHIALVTLSASATPDGDYISPVDHMRRLSSAWTKTYHAMRNAMVRAGFESDQWTYDRRAEPHRGERGGGVNLGYSHEHIILITDGPITRDQLQPIAETHVKHCDGAKAAAHGDGAIEVKPVTELTNVARYVADYCAIDARPLTDRSPEYLMWAAAATAANYRTVSRSESAHAAATADMCKQRYESDESRQRDNHGDEVMRKNGRIVCRHCGSHHGIEQPDSLAEYRLMTDGAGDARIRGTAAVRNEMREIWADTSAGGRVGMIPKWRYWQQRCERIEWPDKDNERQLRAINEWLDFRDEWQRDHRETLPPYSDEAMRIAKVHWLGLGHMEYAGEPVGFGTADEHARQWHVESVEVYGERRPASAGGGVEMVAITNYADLFKGLYDPDGANTCMRCGTTLHGDKICKHIADGTHADDEPAHRIRTRRAAARIIYRHDSDVTMAQFERCNKQATIDMSKVDASDGLPPMGCECGGHVIITGDE